MVRSEPCSTPTSSSTRSEPALLVGSTIRASTSCLNDLSPTASNPNRVYAPARTCHNTALALELITACPAGTAPALRSSSPCPGYTLRRAAATNAASSASVRADPQMLQHPVPSVLTLSDLHRSRPRGRPDLAHEDHRPTLPAH